MAVLSSLIFRSVRPRFTVRRRRAGIHVLVAGLLAAILLAGCGQQGTGAAGPSSPGSAVTGQAPSARAPAAASAQASVSAGCGRITGDDVRAAFGVDLDVKMVPSREPVCTTYQSGRLSPTDAIFAYQFTLAAEPGAANEPNYPYGNPLDHGTPVGGVGDRASLQILQMPSHGSGMTMPPLPGQETPVTVPPVPTMLTVSLNVGSGADLYSFTVTAAQIPGNMSQDAAVAGLTTLAHEAGF